MNKGHYGMRRLSTLLVGTVLTALAFVGTTSAWSFEPTKFVLSSHVGSEVDKTKHDAAAPREEQNQCTVVSKDECQIGRVGSGDREFERSNGVAVSPLSGDVYVSDTGNHRVQVLDADGNFILMFGWNVNKTKVAGGNAASQLEKNICTAASHDECGAGESGTGLAEQLGFAVSLTVDPSSGNVFIFDVNYDRVDEYAADGKFVLMIGGDVNGKGANVCTAAEAEGCRAGVRGSGHGEFELEALTGNTLAVGPEGDLFVADKARIDKFDAKSAAWQGEISLSQLSTTEPATGVAVDPQGNVFVLDSAVTGIYEYSAAGNRLPCVIDGQGEDMQFVRGIAIDGYGRLGAVGYDVREQVVANAHGELFKTQGQECGARASADITPPSGGMGFGLYEGALVEGPSPNGLSFDLDESSQQSFDRLYVADTAGFFSEVEIYNPVRFPEVHTCATQKIGFTEAELCGEIDPNGLEATGFFKYWRLKPESTETFGEGQTPTAFSGNGEAFVSFGFALSSLIPNENYWDEAYVQAEAEGKVASTGGTPAVSFHTLTPAPEIPGKPEAFAVSSQSAVVKALVNPEHALTRAHFEYARCESESQGFGECASPQSTGDVTSTQYGPVGVTRELTGLAPAAWYRIRLVADNAFEREGKSEGGSTIGAEGIFETEALARPTAQTGTASAITSTSAVISGAVNPDGQPATYTFELGTYEGSSTRYGVVVAGSVAAGREPITESASLQGLQPGTEYAFRIDISSGYVLEPSRTVYGPVQRFTTAGMPSLIEIPAPLQQLPSPIISFPKQAGKKASTKKLTPLARALKACKRKPKRKRAACEKKARSRYRVHKVKAKRK